MEKNNEELNKKSNSKSKIGKIIIFMALFFLVVICCGIILFQTDLWNSFSCGVSEIYYEITGSDNDVDAKPVIYLYPEKEIDIEIKLDNVDFTATYPAYKNGWVVTANPSGILTDSNKREYNYLYWEGYSNYQADLSKGFVVSKNDYISFLEEKLEYIGLSDREACDFISYWLPICNKYDYMLISFQKDYGKEVKIEYSVTPTNELIVFAAFKGLDKPIEIEEQDLSYYKYFKRDGFYVVEWGGTIVE